MAKTSTRPVNGPSTTGNQSGKGRGNNEAASPKPSSTAKPKGN